MRIEYGVLEICAQNLPELAESWCPQNSISHPDKADKGVVHQWLGTAEWYNSLSAHVRVRRKEVANKRFVIFLSAA